MTLPTPDPAFRWSDEPWGSGLRCSALEPIAQHVFTTRQLQLRDPKAASANAAAWAEAAAAVGARADCLVRIRQVHGSTVHVIRKDAIDDAGLLARPPADAAISNRPGLALAVQVADCVPLLLVDAVSGAAGAVHAGWRGTHAGISRSAVEAMRRELGAQPRDLLVAIGPSIGACCYQVGEEVLEAFRRSNSHERVRRWFSRTETGSLRLDLWAANRDQLIESGVGAERIFVAGLCTRTHADLFDSYRAAGEHAGRMAGLIAVPTGPIG